MQDVALDRFKTTAGQLTTPEQAWMRMCDGVKRDVFDEMHRTRQWAFGDPEVNVEDSIVWRPGDLPDVPDVKFGLSQVGRSKMAIESAQKVVAMVVGGKPRPIFTGADRVTQEILADWFVARYEGQGMADGGMDDDVAAAIVDGVGFGWGGTIHGFQRNPETRMYYTSGRHVDQLCLFWDMGRRSPLKSRYVAALEWVPLDEALTFKNVTPDMAEPRNVWDADRDGFSTVYVVRFVTYYDVGFGLGRPSKIVFAGPLGENRHPKVIERAPNPFKGRLPVSFCVGFMLPGMPAPVGLVWTQKPALEAAYLARKQRMALLDDAGAMGFDVVDGNVLKPDDQAMLSEGRFPHHRVFVANSPLERQPVQRVPAREMPEWLRELEAQVAREWNDTSGVSEMDQGGSRNINSATEASIAEARTSRSEQNPKKQALSFLKRFAVNMLRVGQAGDTDPVHVEAFGSWIRLNDPSDTRSSLSVYAQMCLTDSVTIAAEPMTAEDDRLANANRREYLAWLVGITGGQMLDRDWLFDEAVKAGGKDDPRLARAKTPQAALAPPPAPDLGAPTV